MAAIKHMSIFSPMEIIPGSVPWSLNITPLFRNRCCMQTRLDVPWIICQIEMLQRRFYWYFNIATQDIPDKWKLAISNPDAETLQCCTWWLKTVAVECSLNSGRSYKFFKTINCVKYNVFHSFPSHALMPKGSLSRSFANRVAHCLCRSDPNSMRVITGRGTFYLCGFWIFIPFAFLLVNIGLPLFGTFQFGFK